MNDSIPGVLPAGVPAPSGALPALAAIDWQDVRAQLERDGVALTAPLLTPDQCDRLAGTFDDDALFRSTVVMQRYGFGRGTYRYYADPAADPLLRELRERLYPPLAQIANEWARRLGGPAFPATLAELHEQCAAAGQHRPTPLVLRYGPGDYACLHQDVYGDIVFPLQATLMLERPGQDFTGGENVFVEQRPRSQSRAIVVRPGLGQALVFPVQHRPAQGQRGWRRHPMRHGTNAVETGRRTTLGVIFHNAR
ncbi:2OG-Fe(II) oxygenase [Kitasatospora sp. NPDC094019]|uniref:2OG-Fe(II) oxygenase n=1 Tax=Kitasatospora sp. NPDC094019 TaxID=3364091 RepID=UPI0037FAE5DD